MECLDPHFRAAGGKRLISVKCSELIKPVPINSKSPTVDC